jgi:Cu(I)/Ag(I) efflux system membrane fusion protein
MNARFITVIVLVAVAAGAGGYLVGHVNRSAAPVAATGEEKGRILYYRNPMGEHDTSLVPKKDSMGMNYIPVYDRELPAAPGMVAVDTAKLQRSGVRIEPAVRRNLTQDIAAVGTVRFNEAQIAVASPRVEGWVERVYVGATGVPVRAGEPLADIYSPELVQTQQEYFLARESQAGPGEGSGAAALAEGALLRMRSLGLSDAQVRQLSTAKEPRRAMTISSPIAGVVSEKHAVAGQKFMPGDVLYRIADASSVWVVAKVFESDVPALRIGTPAAISVTALSDTRFNGTVGFIAPAIDPSTRTADVRIDLPNPDGALRADMYATVRFSLPAIANAVSVPDSAIIDSGTRQVVLVAKGNGRFEPREVATGARSNGYTAIAKGLSENESVVVNATFLIDSESNLRAALQSLGSPVQAEPKP